jgi:phosphatidylglycerophosphate synthase
MRSTLILTIDKDEPLQSEIVAGLPLGERLWRSARQAGFDAVAFHDDIEPGGESTEQLFALLPPGYLPDGDFLKALLALPTGQHDASGVLVHRTNEPETFLKRLRELSGEGDLITRLKKDFPTDRETPASGHLFPLASRADIPGIEDRLFKSLVKDTEGFMSKHVERRISLALSRRLVLTAITANQMTLFSVFVGLVGAGLMAWPEAPWPFVGALFFLGHSILDGCDGELARIRFEQSRLGGLLDYWGDNVVHSAVFLAVAMGWSASLPGALPWVLSALAIAASLASAGWIYYHTMRKKTGDGPLYTSVSSTGGKSRATKVADMLSRRDFIYLVVVLAYFQKLHWFLVMSAIGAPAFFLTLLWIHFSEKPRAR